MHHLNERMCGQLVIIGRHIYSNKTTIESCACVQGSKLPVLLSVSIYSIEYIEPDHEAARRSSCHHPAPLPRLRRRDDNVGGGGAVGAGGE